MKPVSAWLMRNGEAQHLRVSKRGTLRGHFLKFEMRSNHSPSFSGLVGVPSLLRFAGHDGFSTVSCFLTGILWLWWLDAVRELEHLAGFKSAKSTHDDFFSVLKLFKLFVGFFSLGVCSDMAAMAWA